MNHAGCLDSCGTRQSPRGQKVKVIARTMMQLQFGVCLRGNKLNKPYVKTKPSPRWTAIPHSQRLASPLQGDAGYYMVEGMVLQASSLRKSEYDLRRADM